MVLNLRKFASIDFTIKKFVYSGKLGAEIVNKHKVAIKLECVLWLLRYAHQNSDIKIVLKPCMRNCINHRLQLFSLLFLLESDY